MAQQLNASQKRGQDRIKDILSVTRDIIEKEADEKLTYRAIANRLGIYVRNVSYYFPTKASLLVAVLNEWRAEYDDRITKVLERTGKSPVNRLKAVIDLYVSDIEKEDFRAASRKLNSELSVLDSYHGEYLTEYLTNPFMSRFKPLISACRPEISEEEVTHRAEMVASLIEGTYMISGTTQQLGTKKNRKIFYDSCRKQALRIALEAVK